MAEQDPQQILAAIQQLATTLAGLKETVAATVGELNAKTDSNTRAIEQMRGQIDDMRRDGVKVDL